VTHRINKKRLRVRRANRLVLETLEPRQLLATLTWVGGAGNGNWTESANWQGGTIPNDGGVWDTYEFGGTSNLASNNNAGGNAGGHNVNDFRFLPGAGAFTLTDNGDGFDMLGREGTGSALGIIDVVNNSTNTQTVDLRLINRGDHSNGMHLFAESGDLNIDDVISDFGTDHVVRVLGNNTVTYNANNTYSDLTWIGSEDITDDFEAPYTVGQVRDDDATNGVWNSNGSGLVRVESQGGNQYLSFGWNGGFRGAYRALGAGVPEGGEGVVSFRARAEDDDGSYYFGLTEDSTPATASGEPADFRAIVGFEADGTNDNAFNLVANGTTLATGLIINTWYDIEMHIDGANDTYDIYLNGVQQNISAINFVQSTTDTLSTFAISGNGGSNLEAHLDDLAIITGIGGNLIVNGNHTSAGAYSVIANGSLGGYGSTSAAVNSSGSVSPGDGGAGILGTGNLNLTGGEINFEIDADGLQVAGTSNDQIDVAGTVTLGSGVTTLNLQSLGNVPFGVSIDYILIDNDGASAVSGFFQDAGGMDLMEGDTISAGGVDYTISYIGGTGNDVVINATKPLTTTGESFTTTEDDVLTQADSYPDAIQDSDPLIYWRLGESAAAKSGDGIATNAAMGPSSIGFRGDGIYRRAVGDVADTQIEGDSAANFGSTTASGTTGDATYVVANATIPSSELTAEMWVRSAASNTGIQMSLLSYYGGDNELLLFNNVGTLRFYVNNIQVDTGISTGEFIDGNWHHVAVAYNDAANEARIFIDGNETVVTHNGGAINTSGTLLLGQEQDAAAGGFANSQKFIGDIDEFAFYDRAIDQAEIQTHYDNRGNLLTNELTYDAGVVAIAETILSSEGASVTISANGDFSYDPTDAADLQELLAGQSVADSFVYSMQDSNGANVTATVSVTVDGRDDSPAATDDMETTDEDTAIANHASVVANDTDADLNDTDRYVVETGTTTTANGSSLTINADGTYDYDPTGSASIDAMNAGDMVTDSLTLTVIDPATEPFEIDVAGGVIAADSFQTTTNGRGNTYDDNSNVVDPPSEDATAGTLNFGNNDWFGSTTAIIRMDDTDGGGELTHNLVSGEQGGLAKIRASHDRNIRRRMDTDPVGASTYYMSALVSYDGLVQLPESLSMGFGNSADNRSTGIYVGIEGGTGHDLVAYAGGNSYDILAGASFLADTTYLVVLQLDVDASGNENLTAFYATDGATTLDTAFVNESVETFDSVTDLNHLKFKVLGPDTGNTGYHWFLDEARLATSMQDLGIASSSADETLSIKVNGVNDVPVGGNYAGTAIENGDEIQIPVLSNDSDVDSNLLTVNPASLTTSTNGATVGLLDAEASAFAGFTVSSNDLVDITVTRAGTDYTYVEADLVNLDLTAFTATGTNILQRDNAGHPAVGTRATLIDVDASLDTGIINPSSMGMTFAAESSLSSLVLMEYDPTGEGNDVFTAEISVDGTTWESVQSYGNGARPWTRVTSGNALVSDLYAVSGGASSLSNLENNSLTGSSGAAQDAWAMLINASDFGTAKFNYVRLGGGGVDPVYIGGIPTVVTYDPDTTTAFEYLDDGETATDIFTYGVQDEDGGQGIGTVVVTINGDNDAPVIDQGESVAVTMSEDGSPTAFAHSITAMDPESDTLNWSLAVGATNGVATVSGTGAGPTIAYNPTADYNGSDAFDVQVTDGEFIDTITVNVTIDAINDEPTFTIAPSHTSSTAALPQSVAGFASNLSVGPANENTQSLLGFNVVGNTNPGLFVSGPAIDASGTLTYQTTGVTATATITVELVDDGGTTNPGDDDTSATQTFQISVSPVYIDDDGNLIAGGTDGRDRLILQYIGGGRLAVRRNNVFYSSFAPTGDIIIQGGASNDTITVSGNVPNDVTIFGGSGSDYLVGATGNDVIFGEEGNDTILGGGGDNYMDGGMGNDNIAARNGNDILIGGIGIDHLNGGSGHDLLLGGTGGDKLVGGLGRDILIGGTSTHQDTPSTLQAALETILTSWSANSDHVAASNAIKAAMPGLLAGSSVTLDDDAIDELSDNSGTDWLFLSIADQDLLRANTNSVIDS
jgi:VCBS repeat-containing protein